MTDLLTPSEETCLTADRKAIGTGYRSAAELAMRETLEAWARERYPGARLVHELVMGRGKVRADLAAIQTDNLAVFEIKSPYDDTTRLLHQAGMFRLAAPELWIVTTDHHAHAVDLITWLMPSIGVLVVGSDAPRDRAGPYRVSQVHEGRHLVPHPRALASLCWVAELMREATRHGLVQQRRAPSHAFLVKTLTETLEPAELLEAVCRQLRGRDALWRADDPIRLDGDEVRPPQQKEMLA